MAEIMNPSKSTSSKMAGGFGFVKNLNAYSCTTSTSSSLSSQTELSSQDPHKGPTQPTDATNMDNSVVVETTSEKIIVHGNADNAAEGAISSSENVISSSRITTEVTTAPNDIVSTEAAPNDGNNNQVPTSFLSTDQTSMTNESAVNNFSSTASATMNESSNTSTTTNSSTTNEKTTITSSSSSSSRQLLHRQITRTSEVKTSSCIKSDLSELTSRFAEMKNLNNSSFDKESIELENNSSIFCSGTGAMGGNGGGGVGDPLITYPDSPQPNATGVNITCFPVAGSRKNSLAIEELRYGVVGTSPVPTVSSSSTINDELKFEAKRSMAASSRTKMFTSSSASEQFKSEERVQSGNTLEKALEQRITSSENFSRQQNQNHSSSSTLKLQTDSYSATGRKSIAGQQQRQISTSSSSTGLFNQEKITSNFSTMKEFSTSSMAKMMNNNFIREEVKSILNVEQQSSLLEYLNETFTDLTSLTLNATQKDVDEVSSKYINYLNMAVQSLKDGTAVNSKPVLDKIGEMLCKAWLIPTHGHTLGNKFCDELRTSGGLDLLISNCDSKDEDIKFSSAALLETSLNTDNRTYVVNNGLEKVVRMASSLLKTSNSPDHSRTSTGILSHLFKHSEATCENVIRLGGLDAILLECRKSDVKTLRHCASALANLSLYGCAENQEDMIKCKVPMWLFPLAFHQDDNIKYYACLAISVLVANKEMEAAVLKSGTLDLVEPFVTSHNPSEFAGSNVSHHHGQSRTWLQRLVPVLSSKRPEARNLAAFHFCMEAGVKKSLGNTKIFHEIGAVESLKKVASCPNAIASKFAAQALKLIGEDVPHKLIQQVPLWSVEDVKQWIMQIGFTEYSQNFEQSRVDGDLLLQLNEENLKEDIGITNGIRRRRFTRELQNLKKVADYSSRDVHNLNHFLQKIGPEFTAYTYNMLNAGIDKDYLKSLSEDQLIHECGINNGIHRLRILENIKCETTMATSFQQDLDKPLDVFISYRRSNGSQLASLLKVHLQVRNFSVFLDVEKLEAGKFDNNLLQSIKQASNFILVLTQNALDRCIEDYECKDWVHREIVAALQSQCNIIPIIDNFQWPEPEQLPEDMRAICRFNGIKWVHDYQDACVEKVERFIRGEVNSNKNMFQELALTTPHGAKNVRDVRSSPTLQRTQGQETLRDNESS